MGSPLAPVLATVFMGHYQKEWLHNYYGFSPAYCTQYVDDIVSVFNSHDEVKRFFSYLNSRHPTIKLLWKQRPTNLFPSSMSLLIIITIS